MTRRPPEPEHDEPERLRDGASGDSALDELGRWFGAVAPPRGLDDAGVARVLRRLDGPTPSRLRGFRGPLLGFALVAVTGAAAGMWALPELTHREVVPPPAHVAPPAPPEPKSGVVPRPARTLVPVPELPAAPTIATSAATPRPVRSSSAAPTASSASDPSDLARESAALERALTALKRDHDPGRALTLLERYAADFPAGVLRLEADIARVDANLALGQRPAALAILSRLPLERVGRGLELGVVRGELYAERDCSRALRDFERVLAANPPQSLDERALFGRASCRAQTGDAAGARADFERYLERYPNGRHAETARERLR
jgi:hypothetical protein